MAGGRGEWKAGEGEKDWLVKLRGVIKAWALSKVGGDGVGWRDCATGFRRGG